MSSKSVAFRRTVRTEWVQQRREAERRNGEERGVRSERTAKSGQGHGGAMPGFVGDDGGVEAGHAVFLRFSGKNRFNSSTRI